MVALSPSGRVTFHLLEKLYFFNNVLNQQNCLSKRTFP